MQPVPFEIVEHGGMKVASNGQARIVMHDPEGVIFRRRGIKGLALRPPAETLIPQLNQLAGELLQRPETTAEEAVSRLLAIAGTVPTAEPQRTEWAVAELRGVRIYCDGASVIVSTQDLSM